ncbi:unnamed protein product [Agarophyton chilense]|eukprot:gb/GEZJ01002098.1/.p1 GENE.gb/GEZJ01002098.1/~~gb/GEZJ01002098.1/.p1  ORF type:complete len:602 (-),score=73.27 gb/GEZJ01002098.1/:725-2530(-)
MRSALGIRRIADVHVSQVMQATDADVLHLRAVLRDWHVNTFQNWPLLLRALTHPSISNWAERILNLKKRSLGPNVLELLGDRVVGTAVALQLLRWQTTDPCSQHAQFAQHPTPSALLRALVGNRGMAHVARRIGIQSLLRWEKPLPPEAHRRRMDHSGVDYATGLTCNTDINALANAYEAVAAAIYLDSALPPAHSFVRHSLLHDVQMVQRANMEIPQFQDSLARELAALLKQQVSFVSNRKRTGRSPMLPIHCFEPVQCEILDLEPVHAERREHDLFHSAVAIRSHHQLAQPFRETDFVSVASHFSVETARIAALEGAIHMICATKTPFTKRHVMGAKPMQLQMRKAAFDAEVPTLEIHLLSDGRWQYDGDYHHLANLLERVGAPGTTALQTLGAQQIQHRIQALRQSASEQEDGWDVHSARYDALFGKRNVCHSGRTQGDPAICPSAVAQCMSIGPDLALNTELARRYEAPFAGIEDAALIVQRVTISADELSTLPMSQRRARVKAYHVLGSNATKLWSVQSSMRDVSQERVEIVAQSEQRGGMSRLMQHALLGDRGLADVDDLRVNGAYVAVGMCVDSVGCSSAMAWLTGAERIAGKR